MTPSQLARRLTEAVSGAAMNPSEVTRVLTDLANGVDPVSGERLPEHSPYHHPQVIRALFNAVGQLARPADGEKDGRPWANGGAGPHILRAAGRPAAREEAEDDTPF